MATLTDFIDVQISRQTQSVTRAAFNIPMFLSAHSRFPERARVYSTIAGVGADFPSDSNAYIAAAQYFSQELYPTEIVLGRKNVPGVEGSVETVADETVYSLIINGTTFSITSAVSATDVSIIAALKAAYDLEPVDDVQLIDNEDGTFLVTSSIAGQGVGVSVSENLLLEDQPSTESWADAINAVMLENSEWIMLNTESHVGEDILEIAAAIEPLEKMYMFSTQDPAIKASTTGHFVGELVGLGYDKTAGMWNSRADTTFPECALTGYQIQPTPGSNVWAFKALNGVWAKDTFSEQEYKNLTDNFMITYETISGAPATTGGQTMSGEWIDVMMGVLWLLARIRERIWFRQINVDKIPYTNEGKAIIEADLRSVLSEAVRNNFLAANPAPRIVAPDVLSVDQNLRTQRIYEGITFEARLAGAIVKIRIRGTVYA